ncbi:metallophosphoesterase [Virgibacillus kekensis]|uniref:Metallophosphoesterase n=1 Tax=Virgibacillus kekensis TaxID=202261 RepID=A0ABV9DE10_9BACI
MNRRTFLKRSIGSMLAVVGLGGGTYYYAREIEPAMLEVTREEISSAVIPKGFQNFKIVQFSDTHVGHHYSLDKLKKLCQKINSVTPDLIVFTGDLVDDPDTYNWNSDIVRILSSLQAKHGKYWIYGNHDHGGYGTQTLREVMDKAGFQLLQNSHTSINSSNESIVLAGIDDVMLGKPDLDKALQGTDPDKFTILLSHEPDFAEETLHYPVHVQFSGHSHGGQVRLPFIGDLYTPDYADKYVMGKYILEGGKLELHVSRGIGTTRVPYRFLCKPQFHVYTLKSG